MRTTRIQGEITLGSPAESQHNDIYRVGRITEARRLP
jgi:hypothetical protein